MESCQGQGQIGDQDPVNRQLFNKTICDFRDKVVSFYDKVKNAKPVSENEVINYIQNQIYNQHKPPKLHKFEALQHLLDYLKKYEKPVSQI